MIAANVAQLARHQHVLEHGAVHLAPAYWRRHHVLRRDLEVGMAHLGIVASDALNYCLANYALSVIARPRYLLRSTTAHHMHDVYRDIHEACQSDCTRGCLVF